MTAVHESYNDPAPTDEAATEAMVKAFDAMVETALAGRRQLLALGFKHTHGACLVLDTAATDWTDRAAAQRLAYRRRIT